MRILSVLFIAACLLSYVTAEDEKNNLEAAEEEQPEEKDIVIQKDAEGEEAEEGRKETNDENAVIKPLDDIRIQIQEKIKPYLKKIGQYFEESSNGFRKNIVKRHCDHDHSDSSDSSHSDDD